MDCYDTIMSPWSFQETDHVLMVTDRLAFLDRWANLPVAALVQYERVAGKAPLKAGGYPNYDGMLAYCKSVSDDAASPWSSCMGHVGNYRGVYLDTLDKSLGAVCLWLRLPVYERDRLLKEALGRWREPGWGYASKPVSTFNESDRTLLVKHLRSWGIPPAHSLHPRYPDSIANAIFHVILHRSESAALPYRVALSVSFPEGNHTPIWGADVDFLWKP
jgi:hypothetical protein